MKPCRSSLVLRGGLLCVLLVLGALGTAHGQTGADTSRRRPDTPAVPVPGQFEGAQGTNDDLDLFRLRLNPAMRLRERLRRDSLALRRYLDSIASTPYAIMQRNITLDPKVYAPSEAEMARRDMEIKQSQGWDKVFANIPRVGFSASLQGIGRVLGLIEDVTPRIKYTLLRTETITVRIYDITAQPVATIVDGVQIPGEYRFDWDMKDSTGARAEAGDYIAEVIASGNRLVMRKRIVVP